MFHIKELKEIQKKMNGADPQLHHRKYSLHTLLPFISNDSQELICGSEIWNVGARVPNLSSFKIQMHVAFAMR